MKPQSNTLEKPAELTPAQLRARHDALIRMGMIKEAKVMEESAPAMKMDMGGLDGVVMSPANPFLSLYREFRAGQITADMLEDLIIRQVCSDESMLNAMEYKRPPSKPDELLRAEMALRDKLSGDQLQEALDKLHKKMSEKSHEVAYYVKSFDRIKSENASNLWWLTSWYEKIKHKYASTHAVKLLSALETHAA